MNYLTKRGVAYLIDLMIISVVITLFTLIMPIKFSEIDTKINTLYEQKINKEIKTKEFLKEYSTLIRERDTSKIGMTLMNVNLILITFLIIPYYRKQTLGQRIMKLKLEGEITLINLLKRNVIVTGFLYLIISMILLIFKNYFILTTIFGLIQITLVFYSLFMVIYRKDNCGLQDIISNTRVVEI